MDMHDRMIAELEAYLDGALPDGECRAFEERMRTEPDLRRAVEQQRQINDALKRTLSHLPLCSASGVLDQVRSLADSVATTRGQSPSRFQSTPVPAGAPPLRFLKPLAAAALLGFAVLTAIWAAWPRLAPPNPHVLPKMEAGEYYSRKLNDFSPYWRCDNAEQFASSFRDRFGQPLLIAATLPTGYVSKGIDYCHTLSPKTMAVLMEADGQPIIVLVDDSARANDLQAAAKPNVHVHKRTIGKLALVELSPLDQPSTLGHFYDPDAEPGTPPLTTWK